MNLWLILILWSQSWVEPREDIFGFPLTLACLGQLFALLEDV